MRKIPFAGVELTSQRVRGLRGNGSGNIGFGLLRIETGAKRTTIIVDIFDIIQQVRDTGGSKRQAKRVLTTCQGYDTQNRYDTPRT